MRLSTAIDRLTKLKEKHGDLLIVGGYIAEDRPINSFSVINTQGSDFELYGGIKEGVFIE